MTTITMTLREIALMTTITAKTDPEKYTSDEIKAIIYKCRGMMELANNDSGFDLLVIRDS